jgi:hypothetical protein
LKVYQLLRDGRLPTQLRAFLENENIRKAGVSVSQDLRRLQNELGAPTTFHGALELGPFARERFATKIMRPGLSDLCATILKQNLPKNAPERISTEWSKDTLPPLHMQYAARDVFAALQIFNSLSQNAAFQPLPTSEPCPNMPVFLFQADGSSPVAYGHISVDDGKYASNLEVSGIKVSKTRAVIEVQRVLVPGALIELRGKAPKQTLFERGQVPFQIVCQRERLRRAPPVGDGVPSSSPPLAYATAAEPTLSLDLGAHTDEPSESMDTIPLSDFLSADSVDPSDPPDLTSFERDAVGERQVATIEKSPQIFTTVRSRVINDAFHIFQRIRISKTHGLLKAFSASFRDAIFIPEEEDKMAIVSYASKLNPPQDWNTLLMTSATWLWRRCRRIIPPPEILYNRLKELFATFGPLKDAESGKPLFNAAAWNSAKQILELARLGKISDIPGIPLYYVIGYDNKANHLPLYKCIRGTNATEGGVHRNIRNALPRSGASARHMYCSLLEYILRHNLLVSQTVASYMVLIWQQVGTLNSTGKRYSGHFDIWLINSLQEISAALGPRLLGNNFHREGWVNGNLYQSSGETFGIVPIPHDLREQFAMLPFDPLYTLETRSHHRFLAEKHNTRLAVIPIHSPPERKFFSTLMRNTSFFTPQMNPQFVKLVRHWNQTAIGSPEIFYKVMSSKFRFDH